MLQKNKSHRKELGATMVDYCVLVGFVSFTVMASARLLGYNFSCIFGGAAYGLTGVNMTGQELRKNVPASMVGAEQAAQCQILN